MEKQQNELKQFPSGAVDFDHFEAQARKLRREATQAFGRKASGTIRRLWAFVQLWGKHLPTQPY